MYHVCFPPACRGLCEIPLADIKEKTVSVVRERAVLAALLAEKMQQRDEAGHFRDPLDELKSLTETAGGVIVDRLIQYRAHPTASTYIGKGKVQELAALVEAQPALLPQLAQHPGDGDAGGA